MNDTARGSPHSKAFLNVKEAKKETLLALKAQDESVEEKSFAVLNTTVSIAAKKALAHQKRAQFSKLTITSSRSSTSSRAFGPKLGSSIETELSPACQPFQYTDSQLDVMAGISTNPLVTFRPLHRGTLKKNLAHRLPASQVTSRCRAIDLKAPADSNSQLPLVNVQMQENFAKWRMANNMV